MKSDERENNKEIGALNTRHQSLKSDEWISMNKEQDTTKVAVVSIHCNRVQSGFFINFGYSFNFTVVYLCQIIGAEYKVSG